MTFNPTLTLKDKAVAKTVVARLKETGQTYFTSDDFRYWLPDEVWDDPAHEIGAWFAKMEWHRHLKRSGHEASNISTNHRREIKLWRVLPAMYGWLASPTMESFISSQ